MPIKGLSIPHPCLTPNQHCALRLTDPIRRHIFPVVKLKSFEFYFRRRYEEI